jgi:hypothetical protein
MNSAISTRSMVAYKTIILSDSHTKVGAFMNWLSSNCDAKLKGLNFSSSNAINAYKVDYIDLDETGADEPQHRVFGMDVDTLSLSMMMPIIFSSTKVVILITKAVKSLDESIIQRLINSSPVFSHRPYVQCFFSEAALSQRQVATSQFGMIGIIPVCSTTSVSDYKQLWEEITDFDVTQPMSAVSFQRNSMLTASAPAKVADQAKQVAQGIQIDPGKQLSQAAGQDSKIASTISKPESKPTVVLHKGEVEMANAAESLTTLMSIDGATGCLIADYTTGMVLAKAGGGVNLDVAGAGNSEVIKSKLKTMAALGIKDTIDDILITLGTQYHIIRPVAGKTGIFIYIVLDRAKANLAMARFKVQDAEKVLAL